MNILLVAMNIHEKSPELYHRLRSKLDRHGGITVRGQADLAQNHMLGAMEACRQINRSRTQVKELTGVANRVALVSDGSAVPGLGDVGPEAALPVLEAKALLFKEYADIDAFPLVLKSRRIESIVETVVNLSPGIGAIALEDLSAPRCFEIEGQLREYLDIPVFDDDQHGTSIVVLAALINACAVVGKKLDGLKVVINGAGAVGTAMARLLLSIGQDRSVGHSIREIIVCDSRGIIYQGREFLNKFKRDLARRTNRRRRQGSLGDAMVNADVFIGASIGGVVSGRMITSMNPDPILICMAYPEPEIHPDLARQAGASVVATSLPDYPNCISSLLVSPAVLRGALDASAYEINNLMKLEAARILAESVQPRRAAHILPEVPSRSSCMEIAAAVEDAALNKGMLCSM